ncbi:DNA replication protein psf2 [Tilletia horrida]|uniref:DNA replication complex GINS protein PSF2 n=1 Tax=Tilletia horrida TaxID=155126 RepID=A0AAN6JSU3_9BASI|nr:DNA replication protein psf2 [Tilletia horrida]KAK0567702.1 DNA replication protein psf2 [Tilletia horrida]
MALPRSLSTGLLPSEIEYIATTETEVSIVPLIAFDRVRLLGGIYGPFRPPAQVNVPLWLASYLKKRKKCRIVPPTWLTVESLSDTLRIETSNPGFAVLPFHYVAIAKVLLDVAPDDISGSDQVRALLKDIREARQSKIMAGLEMINAVHLEMTNISAIEIAELRPFFSTAFKELRGFQKSAALASGQEEEVPDAAYNFGDQQDAPFDNDYEMPQYQDDAFPAKGAGGIDDYADEPSLARPGYGAYGPRTGERRTDMGEEDDGEDEGDDAQQPPGRRSAAPMVEEYEMD